MKTKERILVTANDLFNRNGVQAITTNHIAKALKMSPGNLYFHYRNKEEILQELFKHMCSDTYQIWKQKRSTHVKPLEFIDSNFEVYWKYRFFHREMYSLRRKDSGLAKMWKKHILKMMGLMNIIYKDWSKNGVIMVLNDVSEKTYVSEALLAMSTTYLQFFENADRVPTKATIERGKKHVARMLYPYVVAETKDSFDNYFKT